MERKWEREGEPVRGGWGEGKSERDLEDKLEQFFQGDVHRGHRHKHPLHIFEILLCILFSAILSHCVLYTCPVKDHLTG